MIFRRRAYFCDLEGMFEILWGHPIEWVLDLFQEFSYQLIELTILIIVYGTRGEVSIYRAVILVLSSVF